MLLGLNTFVRGDDEPNAAAANTLVIATMYGPIDLDPIYAWDSASIDVIDQVVEGLFAYDLSDPDLALTPRLATGLGSWNAGADEYTVQLRQGVTFHDGTAFNASSVVDHWDRMTWAINSTGTNTQLVTQTASLYLFPDGVTPIVKNVTVNSNYNITFFLNGPYIPFEAVLAFSSSYIQSPTHTATLNDTYIITATGDIVGTGPFVYDSYEAGVEVLFHAFDDYWGGRAALDFIVLSEIIDANARNAALLSGDVDLLQDPMDAMLGVFNLTSGITLEEGPRGTVTQYLGMNNVLINRTWREAISYAIDYDYLLDELRDGQAYRMKSPIPAGIQYNNQSHPTPFLNVTYAREVVQSMGFGVGLNTSAEDTNLDWVATNFRTFNYTYNIGNDFRENMLVLLQDNLAKIGITVTDAGGTWAAFVGRLNDVPAGARNELELFWVGWGPDYNDPSNFINPLFTNSTAGGNSNGAQYNGFTEALAALRDPFDMNDNVQLLMDAAILETDPQTREQMYDRIQELLKLDFAWAWGYVSKGFRAYKTGMTGYELNAMGREWWYPISFSVLDSVTVTSPMSTDVWETATNQFISWDSTGSIANVKIELYMGGSLDSAITNSTINNGVYVWAVPVVADGTTYQIKISDAAGPVTFDMSDNFEIFTPAVPTAWINILNPSGALVWEAGTSQVLAWTSTTGITNVKIELFSGATLNATISASTANDGMHTWAIPAALEGDDFTIKISDAAVPATSDTSDTFEIEIPEEAPATKKAAIPGYDLYLLFTVIGIVSVVLIIKKFKPLKK